jgi:hypothetical protein
MVYGTFCVCSAELGLDHSLHGQRVAGRPDAGLPRQPGIHTYKINVACVLSEGEFIFPLFLFCQ